MKKRIKDIIVITAAIGVTISCAFFIPNASHIKGRDSYKSKKPNTVSLQTVDGINQNEADSSIGANNNEDQVPEGKAAFEVEAAAGADVNKSAPETAVRTSNNSGSGSNNAAGAIQGSITESAELQEDTRNTGAEAKKYSREWVEKKIEEHKDEIDEEDLINFRYILGKLGYEKVSSYFAGGLTQEEQSELYSYMRNVLSESEFECARQLFIEYNWLLYEE